MGEIGTRNLGLVLVVTLAGWLIGGGYNVVVNAARGRGLGIPAIPMLRSALTPHREVSSDAILVDSLYRHNVLLLARSSSHTRPVRLDREGSTIYSPVGSLHLSSQ